MPGRVRLRCSARPSLRVSHLFGRLCPGGYDLSDTLFHSQTRLPPQMHTEVAGVPHYLPHVQGRHTRRCDEDKHDHKRDSVRSNGHDSAVMKWIERLRGTLRSQVILNKRDLWFDLYRTEECIASCVPACGVLTPAAFDQQALQAPPWGHA